MRLDEKKALTATLARKLDEADVVYLTDFTGLGVESMNALRRQLRAKDAEFLVVKNTLALRALIDLDLPDITDHFSGPTGLVLSGSDPVPAAKVVKDFAAENENRPVFKIGVVDRREIPAEVVYRMADLPSMDVLLGSIAGSLTAGVSGVVGGIAAVIRDIAVMIEEVAKKEEAGA